MLENKESLGYVLGALKGDGCVYRGWGRIYYIRLVVKDYDFAEAFAKVLITLDGKNTVVKRFGGYYKVDICRRGIVEYIKSLISGGYDSLLFNNKELARGFLRGFFDSEGSCSKGYLIASNTDKLLIELVVDLLDCHFGIEANIHKVLRWVAFPSFYIYIPVCFYNNFLNEIGFSIKRKQEELDERGSI